jgi:hypothetical protein
MIALHAHAPYAGPATRVEPAPGCELCLSPLGAHHGHVVEIGVRGVLCVCRSCAILFSRSAAQFRTVPERVVVDRRFALTAVAWTALGLQVGLAFCVCDSTTGCDAICYPGPTGIVATDIDPAIWRALAAETPLAAECEPDVEALFIHGETGAAHLSCYLVPITCAYELVARLRGSRCGPSGAAAADGELAAFFAELELRGGMR